jgi:hypothetical protein
MTFHYGPNDLPMGIQEISPPSKIAPWSRSVDPNRFSIFLIGTLKIHLRMSAPPVFFAFAAYPPGVFFVLLPSFVSFASFVVKHGFRLFVFVVYPLAVFFVL